MKKITALLMTFVMMLSLQGCDSDVKEGFKRISNEDCNCSITIPDEWETDLYLHEEAVLEGGNYDLGELMMVLAYQKPSDEYTVKDYAEAVLESFIEGAEYFEEVRRKNLVIDGMKAIQIQADAKVSNQATSNFFTFLESDTHFYNVTAWSNAKGFKNSKRRLLDVVISFEVE